MNTGERLFYNAWELAGPERQGSALYATATRTYRRTAHRLGGDATSGCRTSLN